MTTEKPTEQKKYKLKKTRDAIVEFDDELFEVEYKRRRVNVSLTLLEEAMAFNYQLTEGMGSNKGGDDKRVSAPDRERMSEAREATPELINKVAAAIVDVRRVGTIDYSDGERDEDGELIGRRVFFAKEDVYSIEIDGDDEEGTWSKLSLASRRYAVELNQDLLLWPVVWHLASIAGGKTVKKSEKRQKSARRRSLKR